MQKMYNLTSSQSDRINFDADQYRYSRNALQVLAVDEIAAAIAADYFDAEGIMDELCDDMDEARARFEDAFAEAKRDLLRDAAEAAEFN